jgi:hypothetical protein
VFWNRVARRYIFKQNIQNWVYFGGPWNGKCWYILWTFGTFCGHFGILKWNLATLLWKGPF